MSTDLTINGIPQPIGPDLAGLSWAEYVGARASPAAAALIAENRGLVTKMVLDMEAEHALAQELRDAMEHALAVLDDDSISLIAEETTMRSRAEHLLYLHPPRYYQQPRAAGSPFASDILAIRNLVVSIDVRSGLNYTW